jgi:hypothetical protein
MTASYVVGLGSGEPAINVFSAIITGTAFALVIPVLGERIRPTNRTPRLARRQKAGATNSSTVISRQPCPDQVVVILKAREPARIMTAIGDKKLNRGHLQIADRWKRELDTHRMAELKLI